VTPARSILNRLRDQLPVEIERTKPVVMKSLCIRNALSASNSVALFGFLRTLSMLSLRSVLNFLKRSSNRSERSCPALRDRARRISMTS
jgi:hypothetical protein